MSKRLERQIIELAEQTEPTILQRFTSRIEQGNITRDEHHESHF